MEKLTAQIAALYLGQKCFCKYRDDIGKIAEVTAHGEITISYNDNYDPFFVCTAPEIKPILRRPDSLTESEARELYSLRYPLEKWGGRNKCLASWWNEHDEWYIEAKYMNIGVSKSWLKLLSWGFDLFDLIDSGVAIDAATLKTETV